jgi:hypothetical protein
MTPEEINTEFKKQFHEDPENRSTHAEILRARFVLLSNPTEDHGKILRKYNVLDHVIQMLVGELPTHEPKKKRSDKYDDLISWCKENHLVQVSAEEVAEQGDISYATALKFIKDRPDLFFKVKKGLYELRDPETVRKEENV